MSKEKSKPGLIRGFFGGLMLTLVLVLAVPVLTALFIGPIVNEHLSMELGPFTPSMMITGAMLLVMILFLLLLGGGKIFKKYGVMGVVGLIAAYWYLGNVYDAILPVIIIMIMIVFSYLKKDKD
jgi:hypothetical protein